MLNMAFCDGSVHQISYGISPIIHVAEPATGTMATPSTPACTNVGSCVLIVCNTSAGQALFADACPAFCFTDYAANPVIRVSQHLDPEPESWVVSEQSPMFRKHSELRSTVRQRPAGRVCSPAWPCCRLGCRAGPRCGLPAWIALATFTVYSNTFRNPFIFDDGPCISGNPTIRSLWPIGRVLSPPVGTAVQRRPIVNLSLAINYAISGDEVWSYRASTCWGTFWRRCCCSVLCGGRCCRPAYKSDGVARLCPWPSPWLCSGPSIRC